MSMLYFAILLLNIVYESYALRWCLNAFHNGLYSPGVWIDLCCQNFYPQLLSFILVGNFVVFIILNLAM